MNEYQKQANDFLKKTGCKLTITFKEYNFHFVDDTERRNIYICQLKTKDGSYTFRFGTSINDTRTNIVPTSYDILACLYIDYSDDFSDFCSNYGYEPTRESKKIYNAVLKQNYGLRRVFTGEQIELLHEIN